MALDRAWARAATHRWVVAGTSRLLHGGATSHAVSPEKLVSFTFDDGPHPRWTPELLDCLDQNALVGTFFVVGRAVAEHPDIVRETRRRGHEIGTHLYWHRRPKRGERQILTEEIARSRQELEDVLGEPIRLMRFPYAQDCGLTAREVREKLALQVVHWTFSSHDSRAKSEHEILERVAPRLRAGAIVLMHDCLADAGPDLPLRYNADRKALLGSIPQIRRLLDDNTLRAVTVSELLATRPVQVQRSVL